VRMGTQGQIRGKVTDEQLKGLLEQVSKQEQGYVRREAVDRCDAAVLWNSWSTVMVQGRTGVVFASRRGNAAWRPALLSCASPRCRRAT
jgi:hypothetical protein